MQGYKPSRRKHRSKSRRPWFWQFSAIAPEAQSIEEKIGKLDLIKLKPCSVKDTVKRIKKKKKPQTGGKYLENTYLIKDLYPNIQRTPRLNNKKCTLWNTVWQFLMELNIIL